jgi:TPR repeat protein
MRGFKLAAATAGILVGVALVALWTVRQGCDARYRAGIFDDTTVEACQRGAERGEAVAQFRWAQMLQHGFGVPVEYPTALGWYERAHAQRERRATRNIGYMYWNGLGVPFDGGASERWFREAAEAGDPLGQLWLAQLLRERAREASQLGDSESGLTPAQGLLRSEAYNWLRKAATQDNPDDAFRELWSMAVDDEIPRAEAEADRDLALDWLLRWAETGAEEPLGLLGRHYAELASSSPAAAQSALDWFKKAAKAGDTAAVMDLATLLAEGDMGLVDEAGAAQWLRSLLSQRASEDLHREGYVFVEHPHWLEAHYLLGLRYLHGRGVSQDEQEAERLLNVAAHADHLGAQLALAQWLAGLVARQEGINLAGADYWLRRAVEHGLGDDSQRRRAQLTLALLMGEGRLKEREAGEALKLLESAYPGEHNALERAVLQAAGKFGDRQTGVARLAQLADPKSPEAIRSSQLQQWASLYYAIAAGDTPALTSELGPATPRADLIVPKGSASGTEEPSAAVWQSWAANHPELKVLLLPDAPRSTLEIHHPAPDRFLLLSLVVVGREDALAHSINRQTSEAFASATALLATCGVGLHLNQAALLTIAPDESSEPESPPVPAEETWVASMPFTSNPRIVIWNTPLMIRPENIISGFHSPELFGGAAAVSLWTFHGDALARSAALLLGVPRANRLTPSLMSTGFLDHQPLFHTRVVPPFTQAECALMRTSPLLQETH